MAVTIQANTVVTVIGPSQNLCLFIYILSINGTQCMAWAFFGILNFYCISIFVSLPQILFYWDKEYYFVMLDLIFMFIYFPTFIFLLSLFQ